MQNTIVLNCHSSQVRVRHKTADCFSITKHDLKNRPVLLARMNHAHARLIKPALHPFDRFSESQWAPM